MVFPGLTDLAGTHVYTSSASNIVARIPKKYMVFGNVPKIYTYRDVYGST